MQRYLHRLTRSIEHTLPKLPAMHTGRVFERVGKQGEQELVVIVPGGFPALDPGTSDNLRKKLKSAVAVAYVDADTRLPVEIKTRDESRFFRFDPPPTEMQVLPADLLAQIKKADDARARLSEPADRPY